MRNLITCWHGFVVLLILLLAGCAQPLHPEITQGGCPPESSPYLKPMQDVDGRITYCGAGDADIGRISTAPYPQGTRHVRVLIAGNPQADGINLSAVTVDGTLSASLKAANSGDTWKSVVLDIPADIYARPFYIQLVDGSTSTFGWAGIGVDSSTLASRLAHHALPMVLALLAAHLWLLAAGCSLPAPWGATTRSLGALIALGVASGVVIAGYIAAPLLGEAVAYATIALPVLCLARTRGLLHRASTLNRQLLPPLALSLFVLWIGLYPFDWDGQDWQVPADRWRQLPMDAWLPLTFSNMTAAGRLDVPMIGDWLSSDRPPLQSGLYLAFFHSWMPAGGLIYQALSTWAQTLVLVPLLAMTARLSGPRQRAAILFALALSPLMLVNALFVWPKLFAAAFCAIFHWSLFNQDRNTGPARWLMAGLAAALAMLAHGGALFALVGSTAAFLLLHRMKALPVLLKTGALSIAAYLPWVGYQRIIDPPGDRLLKWHFAGHVPVTDQSFPEVLRAAYSNLGFGQWLEGRAANLGSILHGSFGFYPDALSLVWSRSPEAINRVVGESFFYGAYSMWFASPLLLLPCALYGYLHRHDARKVNVPWDLVLAAVASFAFWIVMIYEPGQTVIHQGAYFSFLASMFLILMMVARCFPLALYVVVALNVLVALMAYIFDQPLRDASSVIYIGLSSVLACMLLIACGIAAHGPPGGQGERC